MKSMKIRITDEEHSRQVQEALFAAGYGWGGYEKTPKHTTAKFLWAGCFGGKEITYEDDDEEYFSDRKATEYFLVKGQFVTKIPEQVPLPKQPTKKLENIFIKLQGTTTKEIARKALEDAGYYILSGNEWFLSTCSASCLTGNDDGVIGYVGQGFPPLKYQERFVWQGMLVEGAYFKQPETPVKETSKFDGTVPLGLKPRKIHDQDRLIEILQACLRYADDGKQVPSEWWAEAQYLNNLMENN